MNFATETKSLLAQDPLDCKKGHIPMADDDSNKKKMLDNPYSFVESIFSDAMAKSNNDINRALDQMNERELLDVAMSDENFVARVPYLSKSGLGILQPDRLCRYRGLIQDMYNNEVYSGALKAINPVTGGNEMRVIKYKDVLPSDVIMESEEDSPNENERYRDRMSFLLVPIPGQSGWVKDEQKRQQAAASSSSSSRHDPLSVGISSMGIESRKRVASEVDNNEQVVRAERATKLGHTDVKSNTDSLSIKATDVAFDSADMFTSFSETCPGIYDEDEDICCIAKMYDCEEACFKLNDMIEIVGIYTSDPILESNEEDMGGSLLEQMMDPFRGFDEMDESQSLPPPRKLGSSFPLLNPVYASTSSGYNGGNILSPWRGLPLELELSAQGITVDHLAVRSWVIDRFTQALEGDVVAAEYAMLATLSRLYSRDESESLLLGSMSLNLCGLAPNDPRIRALAAVISDIVPRCVKIQADIDSLNAVDMIPDRNISKNRLSLSPLQLGEGTVLLIDETSLGVGNLNEKGARSVSAISSIVKDQKLPMSYPYYELKILTDLPLLLFTSSPRGHSLFGASESQPFPMVVQRPIIGEMEGGLEGVDGSVGESKECSVVKGFSQGTASSSSQHSTEASSSQDSTMSGSESDSDREWTHRVRSWWASVRVIDVTMSEAMATSAVDDFATARQSDLRLTQADFHRWLTVSRLLTLSQGDTEITAKHWGRMRELELIRLNRNASLQL